MAKQQALPPDVAAYPTSLPSDTFVRVVGILRGQFGDKREDAHELWAVAGYALGKAFPDGAPVAMAAGAECPPCPPDECAAFLEQHAAAPASFGVEAGGSGKWLGIIAAIIKALLPLLVA